MSEEKVVKLGKRTHKEHKQEEQELPQQNEPVFCSFCGRPNTEVLKMVKGPGVNICSECTMIAVQYLIMNDRMPSEEAQKVLDAIWRISK
ncbi:ClpX C4-type zinc finger protein [bacterium]|nr:ClpX C4-type zinc finger protein [bacterium]